MVSGLLLIAISVCFFIKSGFGVTVITSIPLTIHYIFPSIDFGVWNIIFQVALMALTAAILRTAKVSYVISVLLAVMYGFMIDLVEPLIFAFPDSDVLSVVYFAISMVIISLGVAIYMRSRLPLLPGDVLIRDVVIRYRIRYMKVKTLFDITCLAISVSMSLLVLGGLMDIGIGTIFSALTIGTCVSFAMKLIDRVFYFEPAIPSIGRFIESEESSVGNQLVQ